MSAAKKFSGRTEWFRVESELGYVMERVAYPVLPSPGNCIDNETVIEYRNLGCTDALSRLCASFERMCIEEMRRHYGSVHGMKNRVFHAWVYGNRDTVLYMRKSIMMFVKAREGEKNIKKGWRFWFS